DIDVIITTTATPDTIFPSLGCRIQDGLGTTTIPAFDLVGACSGFLYGMIVAEGMILGGVAKRILLIASETLSRITNYKDRNTCVLFGDGSGAFVLEESFDESGMLSYYWKSDGSLAELLSQPGGGTRIPTRRENVDLDLQYLHMKGNEVFKHAVKKMGEAAVEAVQRAGLEKKDIDFLFPHQANIRIIEATGRRLDLPEEKVFINIHKYGNMSCATIPIGVHEMLKDGRLKPGHHIVLVAFGAGFTWASVAYRI
ncbi:beta-ketoacyl-ACP synthase III, partial [Acidobacteriota bacterium]